MSNAEDRARQAGTSPDIVDRVKGLDFLTRCLAKAKFGADLLQDTVDACDINDLNALVLGSGILSVSEASEKLFLMQDEANTVVTVCRRECLRAGVNFGDGAKLTPEEMAEADEDVPVPPAPRSPGRGSSQRMSPRNLENPLRGQSTSQSGAPAAAPASVPAALAAAAAPAAVTVLAAAPTSVPVAPPATAPPRPAPEASPAQPVPSSSAAQPAARAATPPATTGPTASTSAGVVPTDPNFLYKPPVQALATPGPTSAASTTPLSARSYIPRAGASATPPAPSSANSRLAKPAARPSSAAAATPPAQPSTSGRDTPRGHAATPATPLGQTIPAREASAYKPSSSAATPSMNGKHIPVAATPAATAVGSSMRPPRPGSAPLSARASYSGPMPTRARPESATLTPAPSAPTPSYAKPTASAKARLSNKDESDLPSPTTPPVTFASTSKPLRRFPFGSTLPRASTLATPGSEEKKEVKRPVFDNIRSSLLRPTAAFLAWSQGKGKKDKEQDLKSSQGLTADQVRSKPIPGTGRSTPQRESGASSSGGPASGAFRLSSSARHEKAQEELARKREEKAREESSGHRFKASPLPGVTAANKSTSTSPKRTHSAAQGEGVEAATVAAAPVTQAAV